MHRRDEPPYPGGEPAATEGSDGAAGGRIGGRTDDQSSAPEEPDDQEVAALYALVAERLKQAHARVSALNVSTDAKTALTRQLLIVTETAKRDLPGAARRLSRFVQDLDAGRPPLR